MGVFIDIILNNYILSDKSGEIGEMRDVLRTDKNNCITVIRSIPAKAFVILYQNEESITLFSIDILGFIETNLKELKLSEDFGTVTSIDESSIVYESIFVDFHEKAYLTCDNMCKVEGLSKKEIEKNIEDAYSNEKTYNIGDYCIYKKRIYKCNTAIIEPEEFDSTKWNVTTIASELKKRLEFKVVEVIDESE